MRGDAPDLEGLNTYLETRSPHARGCTELARCWGNIDYPFPACAGMHRPFPAGTARPAAVPRMRGDAPSSTPDAFRDRARSPHARGCTVLDRQRRPDGHPFPACAGMHRPTTSREFAPLPVPRMRGDAPASIPPRPRAGCRSPHARGCTVNSPADPEKLGPFPACAGMHRKLSAAAAFSWSVPRMRGDAPPATARGGSGLRRSPHARGCTVLRRQPLRRRPPFPACAGMHRPSRERRRLGEAVPRMRGDAPSRRM